MKSRFLSLGKNKIVALKIRPKKWINSWECTPIPGDGNSWVSEIKF